MPVAGENETPKSYTPEQVEALVAERIAAETEGLKKNRDEVLKEKAKLAKAYEGLDPEKARKAIELAERLEREKQEGAGNWKALESQLLEKHTKEIGAREEEGKRLRSALSSTLIDRDAIAELARHSDTPELLLPHVIRQMRVVEEDGKFYARVVDENGNVRIGKGQGSTPMTLSELVEDMKANKTFAPAFRGTGSSGGGATKSNAGGSGSRTVSLSDGADFLNNVKDIADGKVKVA